MAIPLLIGAVLGLACLITSFFFFRRKRLIDDLPTSKTQGVFIGITELKGTGESDTPLKSYLSGISCVQYSWTVDEHWSRMVITTSTDSKGHVTTSTHQESGWTNVAKGGQSPPFYLKDDTGIIRIVPDGATIENLQIFDKTVGMGDPLYYGKGPQKTVPNSDHRRRFHEHGLPLHTRLYIIGQARQREDIVAAEIARDKKVPMFLISNRQEKQVSAGYGRWFAFCLSLGLLLVVLGVLIAGILNPAGNGIETQYYAIAIGGYAVAFGLIWLWMVHNSLVSLNQRVNQAWSQVDIQLKRRSDLIPNLVQAVEGYAQHESKLQLLVTSLRKQLSATPPGVIGPDFSGCAPSIRAVLESYPDLKSNELFLKLQQSLTDTEERIALSRDYFNQIATFYNIRREIIPDKFVASMLQLKPRTLMSAADFERAPVQVKLFE